MYYLSRRLSETRLVEHVESNMRLYSPVFVWGLLISDNCAQVVLFSEQLVQFFATPISERKNQSQNGLSGKTT